MPTQTRAKNKKDNTNLGRVPAESCRQTPSPAHRTDDDFSDEALSSITNRQGMKPSLADDGASATNPCPNSKDRQTADKAMKSVRRHCRRARKPTGVVAVSEGGDEGRNESTKPPARAARNKAQKQTPPANGACNKATKQHQPPTHAASSKAQKQQPPPGNTARNKGKNQQPPPNKSNDEGRSESKKPPARAARNKAQKQTPPANAACNKATRQQQPPTHAASNKTKKQQPTPANKRNKGKNQQPPSNKANEAADKLYEKNPVALKVVK